MAISMGQWKALRNGLDIRSPMIDHKQFRLEQEARKRAKTQDE